MGTQAKNLGREAKTFGTLNPKDILSKLTIHALKKTQKLTKLAKSAPECNPLIPSANETIYCVYADLMGFYGKSGIHLFGS
ncbi:MAG: hypothetical protein WCF54_14740 [Terracidiphilus sp.]